MGKSVLFPQKCFHITQTLQAFVNSDNIWRSAQECINLNFWRIICSSHSGGMVAILFLWSRAQQKMHRKLHARVVMSHSLFKHAVLAKSCWQITRTQTMWRKKAVSDDSGAESNGQWWLWVDISSTIALYTQMANCPSLSVHRFSHQMLFIYKSVSRLIPPNLCAYVNVKRLWFVVK